MHPQGDGDREKEVGQRHTINPQFIISAVHPDQACNLWARQSRPAGTVSWLQLFHGWIRRSGEVKQTCLQCLLHNMGGLITSCYNNLFCIGPMQNLVKPFTLHLSGDSLGSELEERSAV